jgi:hypothetical protein
MLERVPYIIDILAVGFVVQTCWIWWRCRQCCREAHLAYRGVDALYDWGKDIAALLKKVGDCAGCGGSEPTWPPKDPGDFPGDFE